MNDDFFTTYETKQPKNETKNTTELTNISELFQKNEYRDKLISMRELVKVSEVLDRPLIILDYKEDTMPDTRTGTDKACFRMDFYFADDDAKTNHYIRTEARYLWDYLKTVNEVNHDLLCSGTLVAMICEGKKKDKTKTKFYYFAGTMDA